MGNGCRGMNILATHFKTTAGKQHSMIAVYGWHHFVASRSTVASHIITIFWCTLPADDAEI